MPEKKTELNLNVQSSAQPRLHQHAKELQAYGTLTQYDLALGHDARAYSVSALNQLLADTIVLRDMYKKHHWQVSGPTFYQLHLLFDKHLGEAQVGHRRSCSPSACRGASVGSLAGHGGRRFPSVTKIPRPPRGPRAGVGADLPARRAHSIKSSSNLPASAEAGLRELGDDGTNDLIGQRRHPRQRASQVVSRGAPGRRSAEQRALIHLGRPRTSLHRR